MRNLEIKVSRGWLVQITAGVSVWHVQGLGLIPNTNVTARKKHVWR